MKDRELRLLKSIYTYLSAGFTLSSIAEKVGGDISEYLRRGMPLSTALKYEGLPEFVVQNIKIGEETGRLKDSIKDVIDVFEKIRRFRADIRWAFVFPYLTFVLSVSIVFVILTYVVPQLLELISDLGIQEDSVGLVAIVKVSNMLRGNIFFSVLIFVVVVLSPIFIAFHMGNPLLRYYEIQILLRSLALCLENGIEIVQALLLVSPLINDRKLKSEVINVASAVMRGIELNFAFLPDFRDELKKAYEVGRLSEALRDISQVFEERARSTYELLRKAVEPLFFVITGGIIILIVVLFYIPIFKYISSAM